MTGTAFLFPGQGSQAVGMGKALAERFATAREIFARIDAALGQNLSRLMFEGPEAELTLTANAQPALMAVSLAAAGALSLEDAARLLRIRGEAMQSAVPVGEGAMAALLGLDFAQSAAIAAEALSELAAAGAVCQAANDNGGGQVVISGTRQAVERAMDIAKRKGARRAVLLPVSAPFHCALMQPAAETMAAALEKVEIKRPKAPIVANVTARPMQEPAEIRKNLVAQVVGAVRWRESVLFMAERGVGRFVELGAGKVLSGLVKRIVEGATATPIGGPAEVDAFRLAAVT